MQETQIIKKKSIRNFTCASPDWYKFAKDIVGIANEGGGIIYIGFERNAGLPPALQKVDVFFLHKIMERIYQTIINVENQIKFKTATNGGEYMEIKISKTISNIARTADSFCFQLIPDNYTQLTPKDLKRIGLSVKENK